MSDEKIINITDCVGKQTVLRDRYPDLRRRMDEPEDLKDTWYYHNAAVTMLSRSKKYVCVIRAYDVVQETEVKISANADSMLSDMVEMLKKHGAPFGAKRVVARVYWLAVDDFATDEHPDRRFKVMDFVE